MAFFRRNTEGAWTVADLPAGTKPGDTVAVAKRDGSVASVLIGTVAPGPDGVLVGIPAPKPRKRAGARACPACGHAF